ncbi:hypothetical protein HanIR_Chr03g0136711 [Helianthus annuus]|nr:hypothetical protein HanIR_Chr03g0136711 [Helianthus annuus]
MATTLTCGCRRTPDNVSILLRYNRWFPAADLYYVVCLLILNPARTGRLNV